MVEVARITQFYLCFALYETLYHHLKRICSKFHAYLDLKLYWDFSNSLSAGNWSSLSISLLSCSDEIIFILVERARTAKSKSF